MNMPASPVANLPGAGRFPIGEAARRAGISSKMVRHYEAIGLLPPAGRTGSGLRRFTEAQVHTLRFIARARSLGFPLRDIARLLSLWHDRDRSSAEVLRLAKAHLADLARRADGLRGMARALDMLVEACAGDSRPECPILDDLAEVAAHARPASVRRGRR